MTASRGARLIALAVACAALFAVVLVSFNVTSGPEGWKTIEYQGVQVDIPSSWERLDMSDCEFQYERWVPPGLTACSFEGGAGFYGAATFDPARRPGVWRTTTSGTDTATWDGYVYAGDFAVVASDTDRDIVQAVLDSARVTGK